MLEKVNIKKKLWRVFISDRQTEKEKVPEVDEKERKTYAEVVRKYVD